MKNSDKSYDAFLRFLNDFKKEIIDEVKNEVEQLLEERYKVNKLYYSLKEVSHISGLTVHALKGRKRRNTLEFVYEGQTPLVPVDEVERLIKKLERQRQRNKRA